MTPLTPADPTIESHELWERIDELEDHATEAAESENAMDEDDPAFSDDPELIFPPREREELDALRELDAQLRYRRGQSDTFVLVREDHLAAWAREYAQGLGFMLKVWPLSAIDWVLATTLLQTTMTRVTFSSVNYYVTG